MRRAILTALDAFPKSVSACTPIERSKKRILPETGEDLQDLSEDLHMWLAYGMLAVAAGHVAAAFKHRWFDDHDVVRRMTFGGR